MKKGITIFEAKRNGRDGIATYGTRTLRRGGGNGETSMAEPLSTELCYECLKAQNARIMYENGVRKTY